MTALFSAVEACAGLASAYVHIPFCARVCPYCDFTVVAGRDDVMDRYLDALCREIESAPPWRPLDAVFVGGGTPSRFGAERLATVLGVLGRVHGITPGAEVTLEANPEDVDAPTAARLVAAGFTRISLGVQSFDDAVLRSLGRMHTGAQAASAVSVARDAAFESISIDLIFGSESETDASWATTVAAAIDCDPDHVSTYGLTVEPGTELWRQVRSGFPEPDPDVQADRWETAAEGLSAAGYVRYEVSNHARPGHHCRYNAAVWGQADYLAFGLGAHGSRDGVRTVNVRRLDTYLERVEGGIGPVQSSERVEGWAREQERLFVGLRRTGGVEFGPGTDALLADPAGERLIEHGVVEVREGRLVVVRPLLTDEVLRTVLGLEPPAEV